MHVAMTTSSFRAGTMAVTKSGAGAARGCSSTDTIGLSLGIFCWMRKGRFRTRESCDNTTLNGHAKENGGVGRGGFCVPGCGVFCAAHVPAGRTHGGGQEGPGLPNRDLGQAGPSPGPKRQGRRAEFLGYLLRAMR